MAGILDWLPLLLVTVTLLAYAFLRAHRETRRRERDNRPISEDSGGETF